MDIRNNIDFRHGKNKYFNIDGTNKYDYVREGILEKCLPKILFSGNNFLLTFLQIIDTRIIMMMQYVDRLKQFKYITNYY